jgi:hypothetical protein
MGHVPRTRSLPCGASLTCSAGSVDFLRLYTIRTAFVQQQMGCSTILGQGQAAAEQQAACGCRCMCEAGDMRCSVLCVLYVRSASQPFAKCHPGWHANGLSECLEWMAKIMHVCVSTKSSVTVPIIAHDAPRMT